MNKVGYHTALVGKWHLGLESPNTPNERGFDFFQGFLGDMMDSYTTHLRHGINYMRLNGKVITPHGHATDLFSDWAVDYLRKRAQERQQPFFLYLAYNAPITRFSRRQYGSTGSSAAPRIGSKSAPPILRWSNISMRALAACWRG